MSKLLQGWLALCLVLVLSFACVACAENASVYRLGDTMQDFTVTLSDGSEVSLSGLLSEKKMVLINFWATWCGPCRMEFPYMEAAYQNHMDDVGIVALSVEPSDSPEVIARFKEKYQLPSLPMGQDMGLSSRFHFTGIPTSVVVDRFGTICMIETGATDAFEELFTFFTAEDYTAFPYSLDIPEGYALYTVMLLDEAGNPVDAVLVQVCDDSTCEVMLSENGLVQFVKPCYPYEIHVLSVPEMYHPVTESFTLPAQGNAGEALCITLTRK